MLHKCMAPLQLPVGVALVILLGLACACVFLLIDAHHARRLSLDQTLRIAQLERDVASVKRQIGWGDDKALTVAFQPPHTLVRLAKRTPTP